MLAFLAFLCPMNLMDKILKQELPHFIISTTLSAASCTMIVYNNKEKKKQKTLQFNYEIPWKLHSDFRFMYSRGRIGEGNGIPLHYSCLENPMDEVVGCSPWGRQELDATQVTQQNSLRNDFVSFKLSQIAAGAKFYRLNQTF